MVVEMHRYCPPSKKESKDQHFVFHLKANHVYFVNIDCKFIIGNNINS